MNLLAIDTATDACSVAVCTDDHDYVRHVLEPRRHADIVFTLIDDALAEAALTLESIEAVAFGRGPGSFTGVRIAASVTQGICLARDIPAVGVSSLEALARAARRGDAQARILAGLDARRGEIYLAAYAFEGDDTHAVVADSLLAPGAVMPPDDGEWICAGNAWRVYEAQLNDRVRALPRSTVEHPSAPHLGAIARRRLATGECGNTAVALPVYLRGATD